MLRHLLLASSALSLVVAQAATITTPAILVECQPAQLQVAGGTAPYYLSVLQGGQVGALPLENLPEVMSAGPVTWVVNVAAGTNVSFSVTDSTGAINYSAPDVVTAGTSTACLTASPAAAYVSPEATSPANDNYEFATNVFSQSPSPTANLFGFATGLGVGKRQATTAPAEDVLTLTKTQALSFPTPSITFNPPNLGRRQATDSTSTAPATDPSSSDGSGDSADPSTDSSDPSNSSGEDNSTDPSDDDDAADPSDEDEDDDDDDDDPSDDSSGPDTSGDTPSDPSTPSDTSSDPSTADPSTTSASPSAPVDISSLIPSPYSSIVRRQDGGEDESAPEDYTPEEGDDETAPEGDDEDEDPEYDDDDDDDDGGGEDEAAPVDDGGEDDTATDQSYDDGDDGDGDGDYTPDDTTDDPTDDEGDDEGYSDPDPDSDEDESPESDESVPTSRRLKRSNDRPRRWLRRLRRLAL